MDYGTQYHNMIVCYTIYIPIWLLYVILYNIYWEIDLVIICISLNRFLDDKRVSNILS